MAKMTELTQVLRKTRQQFSDAYVAAHNDLGVFKKRFADYLETSEILITYARFEGEFPNGDQLWVSPDKSMMLTSNGVWHAVIAIHLEKAAVSFPLTYQNTGTAITIVVDDSLQKGDKTFDLSCQSLEELAPEGLNDVFDYITSSLMDSLNNPLDLARYDLIT